jgi:hypothetical protein
VRTLDAAVKDSTIAGRRSKPEGSRWRRLPGRAPALFGRRRGCGGPRLQGRPERRRARTVLGPGQGHRHAHRDVRRCASRRPANDRLRLTPMTLLRVPPPLPRVVDLQRTYDAIVVGSGAGRRNGCPRAHLARPRRAPAGSGQAGDTTAELKSLEWPYDHPRRGDMPYTSHALRGAEYALRKPPYAPKDSPWKTVQSYVQGWSGSDYSKNILVDEKEHPYTGTNYAWVRARVLGARRTSGAARTPPERLRLQGQEPRRLGRGLADLVRGHRALLRQGRPLPRDLGHPEGLPISPTASSSARRASTRPR